MRYLALLLLAGCAAEVTPPEAPPYECAKRQVFEAWSGAFGAPEGCDLDEIAVVEATDPELEALCMWRASQIEACYAPGALVVKRAHAPEERMLSVEHEMLHWLTECSGLAEDADANHSLDAVWALERVSLESCY